MRDTKYATELGTSTLHVGQGHELRIEKLWIKEKEQIEIRFSWWKDNRLIPRPPDGTVEEWLKVFEEAIKNDVLPEEFIKGLKEIL